MTFVAGREEYGEIRIGNETKRGGAGCGRRTGPHICEAAGGIHPAPWGH